MQIRIAQTILDEALRTVGRAVSARSTIGVLSGVHLKAEGQTLLLRATDLELTIGLAVPAAVSVPGEAVLPARYLSELIRRLPPVEVTLALNPRNNTVRLGWEESEAVVHGFDPVQLPSADCADGEQAAVHMKCRALATLLRETGFAAAHDESRPWLTGIFLTVQDQRAVALATDGAIIAYSEAALHNPAGVGFSVILPGRSLQELIRLLAGSPLEECAIIPAQGQFRFELGGLTLTSRLLEGSYPDFRRQLPQEYPSMVTLDQERFTTACERAALAAQQGAVRLEAGTRGLCLTAHTPEVGEVAERLGAQVTGAAFAVSLNIQFVLNGLRSMTGEQVVLEFAGNRQAVRFRSGPASAAYFSVLPLLSF